MRPSLAVTATKSVSFLYRIMIGAALNSTPGAENQSFGCSVARSRATTAFAYVRSARSGALPSATYKVPSPRNAGPVVPMISAPPVFQLVTLLSAVRSIAQTALGAAPQPLDVVV